MSQFRGYTGKSLEFLKQNNTQVGDSVKITTDLTYSGIIMPRYEHADDKHIVLKLKSGYNVGINLDEIKKISKVESNKESSKQVQEIKKILTCQRYY